MRHLLWVDGCRFRGEPFAQEAGVRREKLAAFAADMCKGFGALKIRRKGGPVERQRGKSR